MRDTGRDDGRDVGRDTGVERVAANKDAVVVVGPDEVGCSFAPGGGWMRSAARRKEGRGGMGTGMLAVVGTEVWADEEEVRELLNGVWWRRGVDMVGQVDGEWGRT